MAGSRAVYNRSRSPSPAGSPIAEVIMKSLSSLVLILSLAACATCKSTDSPEVCRTKERDHSQPRLDFALTGFLTPRFSIPTLRAF